MATQLTSARSPKYEISVESLTCKDIVEKIVPIDHGG
jgi:hypothetical protein